MTGAVRLNYRAVPVSTYQSEEAGIGNPDY